MHDAVVLKKTNSMSLSVLWVWKTYDNSKKARQELRKLRNGRNPISHKFISKQKQQHVTYATRGPASQRVAAASALITIDVTISFQ